MYFFNKASINIIYFLRLYSILIISLFSISTNSKIPNINFIAPEIQGTAAPFSQIRFELGLITFGFTSADKNGNWSFTLNDQIVNTALTQTSQGGESKLTDPIKLQVSQTVSEKSSTLPNGPSQQVKITFPSEEFTISIVTAISGFRGNSESFAIINTYINGQKQHFNFQANASGLFNIQFNTNPILGFYFKAVATDPKGNRSTDQIPVVLQFVPVLPVRSPISKAVIGKYCPNNLM